MSCLAQINGASCFPLLKDLSAVALAEGIKGCVIFHYNTPPAPLDRGEYYEPYFLDGTVIWLWPRCTIFPAKTLLTTWCSCGRY